jgi:hypothetical protein
MAAFSKPIVGKPFAKASTSAFNAAISGTSLALT